LALICLVSAAVLFCTGCATDPTTGKSSFSPVVAYQATTQPAVQAVAAAVPYGSTVLGLAGLVFLALSKYHDTSSIQAAINGLVTSTPIATSTTSVSGPAPAPLPVAGAQPTVPKT
jgi:hypothetical protein